MSEILSDRLELQEGSKRKVRADARRNVEALLRAALEVFASSGVDAPVREIAERAGVGIGTIYRHFPQRSDLIVAVFQQEVDACAEAAETLAKEHEPVEALSRWLQRYVQFIGTKRGLADALHSGDAAYDALPEYFMGQMRPALSGLLERATAAGEIRPDTDPDELLSAVASLSTPYRCGGGDYGPRMVELLVDGLRYGARRRD